MHAAESVDQRNESATFGARVMNQLPHALSSTCTPQVEVARRLGVSSRSMQRYLSSEGVTFEGLLDGKRKQLAEQYLEDKGRSVAEVALLLGYGHPSSFHRAFRRWTGRTPRSRAGSPRA